MESIKASLLKLTAQQIANCTGCELHKTRTNTVPGAGDSDSKLVFFGEGPGADEDAQGLPFVGRAGKLLTNMIKSIDMDRDSVFIMNAIKCRPPNNRKPSPAEITACSNWFKMQLALIKPAVIVALGATATEALCGPGVGITKRRGKWESLTIPEVPGANKIAVMPTLHPAYLLRNPAAKADAWNDLQMVKEYLETLAIQK